MLDRARHVGRREARCDAQQSPQRNLKVFCGSVTLGLLLDRGQGGQAGPKGDQSLWDSMAVSCRSTFVTAARTTPAAARPRQ